MSTAADELSRLNPGGTGTAESRPGGVPRVLEPSILEELQRQFVAELTPDGPVEWVLVLDLARQAAAMDRWHETALAAARHGARTLPMLTTALGTEEQSILDSILAGAMSTDAAERSERHSLARTRAFHRTLQRLEELQDRRRVRERAGTVIAPKPFADEAACEAYFLSRLRRASQQCSYCGSSTGSYLSSRRIWECGNCRKQFGLRWGTVMAGSALSLFLWSEAVRWLLWRPTISAAELAEKIGLSRLATVRSMIAKIRTAMAAENASERLAGLDRHFGSDSSP